MYHFFEAIQNTSGDALPGYLVKLFDSSGTIVPIYSDSAGTPIVNVSGIDDTAVVADDGNVALYVNPGVYSLGIYSPSGAQQKLIKDYAMGFQVITTSSGSSVNLRSLLAAVSSPVAGQSAILTESGREGTFVFSTANLSTQVAADTAQDIYVAPSTDTSGASGAWVRRPDSTVVAELADHAGRLTAVEGAAIVGRLGFATYAELAAITGEHDGQVAEIPPTDTGTHTDPVVGGTVNNAGVFRWSASPAGWERIADTDALSASGYANAAAADAASAAADASAAAASASLAGTLTDTPPSGSEIAMLDQYGRAAAYFDSNGQMLVRRASLERLNGADVTDLLRRINRLPLPALADYLGVIIYGQSKSLGNGAGVSTFAADIPNAFMFNANGTTGAGPRAQEGSGTVAQNHASLVALAEQLNSSTANAETGLGNFARMLNYLLQTENGVTLSDLGVNLICSAPGHPNVSLAMLSKGSAYYTNLTNDVTYGASLAAAAGKTYAVPAILFAQGEYDIETAHTSRATYSTQLQQLVSDLNTDIKAITGQTADIPLIVYQVMTYDQSNTDIALAQADAATADSRIIISHPDYCVPHISSTNVHYREAGYAFNGAYFARAFKRKAFDGYASHLALKQSGQIIRSGTVLSVPFDVPVPPLVLDNTYFPTQTNSGFYAMKASDGTENVITAVAAAYNRVRITLTSAEAGTLYYLHGSTWGGNLHDSDAMDAQAFLRRSLANNALAFATAFN